ncbi:uncharacterized protein LOC143851283 [Tasmannia lanceolata]|uniref:uncharacterized protein LOC143851283 n=1 Tax=Tasmannia lanceolata TaxID=3420 RepID=UPI00406336B1
MEKGKDPTLRRPPTFAEKYENYNKSRMKSESEQKQNAKTSEPSMVQPASDKEKAGTWEKGKMAKIKDRYEKLRTTILSWENEKKTKARRQLDRKESEVEKRRARATKKYHREIERINKIAGGARVTMEERKRNDESNTREKAKLIRKKGKVSATCFCF